jgi:hypothetical protein
MAAVVGQALQSSEIKSVLTGGACASLYSQGAYQSADLDFILLSAVSQARLDNAMASVGFHRERDHYVHPASRFFVEFPAGPLGIGSDIRIQPVVYAIGNQFILTLSATDSCRDRLAAFYHWNDRQSLETAIAIALRQKVNVEAIRAWSVRESAEAGFKEFLSLLKAARRP